VSNDVKNSTSRIWPTLAIDVPVILVLSLLVAKGRISAYPGAAIVIVLLFALNLLILWRIFPGSRELRVRLSYILSLSVFTIGGIVTIVAFLSRPSVLLGLQSALAVLLLGYPWFAIYRIYTKGKS
jgi:hypothetical protein